MTEDVFSFPLALAPGSSLFITLHRGVQDPHVLAVQLKEDGELALLDASRIISIKQLVCAANMACQRRDNNNSNPTWNTVFLAAPSCHLGHVLRDYAFGEEASAPDVADILVFSILQGQESGIEEYKRLLKKYNLSNPSPMADFLANQAAQETQQYMQWYKISQAEMEFSTLENAVLTRIATKNHV